MSLERGSTVSLTYTKFHFTCIRFVAVVVTIVTVTSIATGAVAVVTAAIVTTTNGSGIAQGGWGDLRTLP